MRMVFGLVLVVGLALAGFAVYMAQGYIGQTQAKLAEAKAIAAKSGPLVEVYVVNKPLNYGDALTKEDVQKIYWPENALPDQIFTDEALLFPEGEKAPRFILRQMEKFEPLMAMKVTEPGEAAGLTGMLEKGQRAFTIKFDNTSGASRYLQPGNNVDIYWTGTSGEGNEVTQLIETSVAIIAVDRAAEDGTDTAAPKTMTVAASPEQVAKLAQGQATGKLSVSLVGNEDDTLVAVSETDNCKLLGNCTEAAAVVEAEKVCTITTTKGGVKEQTPIPCTN